MYSFIFLWKTSTQLAQLIIVIRLLYFHTWLMYCAKKVMPVVMNKPMWFLICISVVHKKMKSISIAVLQSLQPKMSTAICHLMDKGQCSAICFAIIHDSTLKLMHPCWLYNAIAMLLPSVAELIHIILFLLLQWMEMCWEWANKTIWRFTFLNSAFKTMT